MNFILPLILLTVSSLCSSTPITAYLELSENISQRKERKLTESEVKRRGIGDLVAEVIISVKEIDLKKMARSSIFETSYGYRWKMYNVQTGKVIMIKVNKQFHLLSFKRSKNT